MKDLLCDDFQDSVSELLVRHKSVLDILIKLQESQLRANKAVVRAVTSCGCIQVNAKKQIVPEEASLQDLQKFMDNHLRGNLCDNCRDVIENELGNHLFYIASLCNLLDISLYDVLLKEYEKINTLGMYSLL